MVKKNTSTSMWMGTPIFINIISSCGKCVKHPAYKQRHVEYNRYGIILKLYQYAGYMGTRNCGP